MNRRNVVSVQPALEASYHLSARRVRGPSHETPHQRIEGQAYEACAELVLYRDNEQPTRLRGDALCDEAIRRVERALATGDVLTAQAALRDYWRGDQLEDDAGHRGDRRVSVAHRHVKAIPGQVVAIEAARSPARGSRP
jgi:hypothetical protein